MTILKNKILIKLIFIISILMIVALNLFGEIEESIEFNYYYYTNKLYHSTLKTEIIPSDYVFITTNSTNGNEYSYLYNLKNKEKKLFYHYSYPDRYYYDINGNLTTNWTDTNMEENRFYEITNNRFGETFYNLMDNSYNIFRITKDNIYNIYIQKAYKYSLTQPEIINKKDRGIYFFSHSVNRSLDIDYDYVNIVSYLCFQNEYYSGGYLEENGLLNYSSNGRIIVSEYSSWIYFSHSLTTSGINLTIGPTDNIYFQLNNKSLIKPTWNEFTNNNLNYAQKLDKYKNYKIFYSKKDIEKNLRIYNKINATKYLGFIPIEEFEYYLLAD